MSPSAAGAVSAAATTLFAYVARVSARRYGNVDTLTMPVAFGISLASGTLAAALAGVFPFGLPASLLLSLAFVNGATDLQSGLCFDAVQLCAASALALSRYANLGDAAVGLLVGTALLGVPYALTMGKGIGLGDVKFAATIGLGVGAYGEMQVVYTAFIAGGIAAVCVLLSGRADRKAPMVFAPFLGFGTVCALVAIRPS